MRYEIIEATTAHILALRDRLRDDDRQEITCVGGTPSRALWRSYRGSVIRRAVLVDGQVAAMWGCGGSLLGGIGEPWLLTAPEIEKIPICFIKESRRSSADYLKIFYRIESYVMASYHRAVRLLEVVGYKLDDPIPFGPFGVPFRRYWMER